MALPSRAEQTAPFTVDDLHAMPDDGNRYELLFGEIVMSPAPGSKHQWIAIELAAILHAAAKSAGWASFVAPLDVHLGLQSVVQPDLVALQPSESSSVRLDGIHGAPTIVVEILSPATRGRDLVRKAVLYAAAGVPEYWIVDVDKQTIAVKRWRDGAYFDAHNEGDVARSSSLPGFEVDVASLFRWPDWMQVE